MGTQLHHYYCIPMSWQLSILLHTRHVTRWDVLNLKLHAGAKLHCSAYECLRSSRPACMIYVPWSFCSQTPAAQRPWRFAAASVAHVLPLPRGVQVPFIYMGTTVGVFV